MHFQDEEEQPVLLLAADGAVGNIVMQKGKQGSYSPETIIYLQNKIRVEEDENEDPHLDEKTTMTYG